MRSLDDEWQRESAEAGHHLPGGVDLPGLYYWSDGCAAEFALDGTVTFIDRPHHDPSALPERVEAL